MEVFCSHCKYSFNFQRGLLFFFNGSCRPRILMGKSFLFNFIQMDIWAALMDHLVIFSWHPFFLVCWINLSSDFQRTVGAWIYLNYFVWMWIITILFYSFSFLFTIISIYSLFPSLGKSYDVVSCVAQEPEASVFLPSSSDSKLGKCPSFCCSIYISSFWICFTSHVSVISPFIAVTLLFLFVISGLYFICTSPALRAPIF